MVEVMATTRLNPNAPMYVPWEYRTVEDFSDRWWELVKTTPWFHGYWLREWYEQEETTEDEEQDLDLDLLLPDSDEIFCQSQRKEGKGREMVRWRSAKWRGTTRMEGCVKHMPKAPKIVKVKRVSPRLIQQPR